MTRVQIPAYTDRWMMGDRYGTIVKITKSKVAGLDRHEPGRFVDIAHVDLDKSGKVLKFVLDDCTPID